MPPRRQAANSQQRGRRSKLDTLLDVGRRALNIAYGGIADNVSSFELTVVESVAKQLADHLGVWPPTPHPEVEALWRHPSQDTAALMALFFLALRQSSPFGMGDSPSPAYANIRRSLCEQFSVFRADAFGWQSSCSEILGPALLRADTLQCYCGLLAEAAEQLAPSAAQLLPRAPGATTPAPVPRPQQLDLQPVQELLREPVSILTVLGVGIGGETGASRQLRLSARDTIQRTGVLEHWARVLLLGTAAAFSEQVSSRQQREAQALQAHLLHRMADMHDLLGLDWADFLRGPCACTLASIHMAQLCAALDGGTAFGVPKPPLLVVQPMCVENEVAFTSGVSRSACESDVAVAKVSGLASLLTVLHTLRAWAALLCEELPEARPYHYAAASGNAGRQRPAEAPAEALGGDVQAGGEGSRHGASGSAAAACPAAPSSSAPGPQGAAGQRAPGSEGQAEPAAGASCLPTLNRSAAVDLCLRLAKGLLAHWGRPVPGLQLDMIPRNQRDAHPLGAPSHRDRRDSFPPLPKLSGSVVVFHALACSRLALLPSLWCKERVEGRARARVRAWWEAYVAAAEHPEALLVVRPNSKQVVFPKWTHFGPGSPRRLGADAALALEAGVLPCVSRLLERMGRGPSDGVVWCPPDRFQGTAPVWMQLMLFGPPVQVGQLLSALARRLTEALGDLRAWVSSFVGGSGGSMSSKERDGCVMAGRTMRKALAFTSGRMCNVFGGAIYLLKDSLVAPGQAQTGVEAVRRLSVVAAVLLPAVSEVVRGCVDLWQFAVVAQGGSPVAPRGGLIVFAASKAPTVAHDMLKYAVVLLAAHAGAVARGQRQRTRGGSGGGPSEHPPPPLQQQQAGDGSSGAGGKSEAVGASGGGDGDGSGCGGDDGDGDGNACRGGVVASSPWRALLLQDMQLMEFLGAGVWLCGQGVAEAEAEAEVEAKEAEADAQSGSSTAGEDAERLRTALVWALALAAAAFPDEFRAAWGDSGAASVVASGPHGSSSHAVLPCHPQLPAVFSRLLGADGLGDGLLTVVRVLGGWDPAPEDVWGIACSCRGLHGYTPDQLAALVEAMLPPGEARAAVAAAAAAPTAPAAAAAAAHA